jgi:hypothetical protein
MQRLRAWWDRKPEPKGKLQFLVSKPPQPSTTPAE